MNTFKIPHFGLHRQYTNLKSEFLDITDAVMTTGIFLDNSYTFEFEQWLAERTKAKHAITVHSGTQALSMIAKFGKELYPDTEINLPNLTYPATYNAFKQEGWDIRLVDTDDTGLMLNYDKMSVEVGLYGADPQSSKSVFVDGAQHWLVASHIGHAMAISFDPTKNLASTGNGGAIVTNDDQLNEKIRAYKNHGKPKFSLDGATNSKISELEAAHLLVRTKHIDEWQARRKKIRNYYLDCFRTLPFRCLSRGITRHSDQKFVITLPDRAKLHDYLLENEIEAKIHYPYTMSALLDGNTSVLPTSNYLSNTVLSLPIYPELTDGEVEYIVDRISFFFNR